MVYNQRFVLGIDGTYLNNKLSFNCETVVGGRRNTHCRRFPSPRPPTRERPRLNDPLARKCDNRMYNVSDYEATWCRVGRFVSGAAF